MVEEQILTFTVTASEPGQKVPLLNADLSDLPPEAAFTDNGDGTGVFSWTPRAGDAANSPYTVVFTATDALDSALADSETVTIAVAEVFGNQPPVLDPIGDRVMDAGVTLNFTVTAGDPDATIPVLSATNLPAGAYFTDNQDGTGTFNWATASSDAGTYPNIIFTATDALDSTLTDLEILTITLNVSSPSVIWPTDGWETATPQQEGMDPVKLAEARDYALGAGGSGYIIKNGKLVMSWGSASKLYDIKSATKSIGSAALGLAVRDGLVQLNNLAQSHLPDFGTPPAANTATGWLGDITLFQLATHTAGFDKTGGYCDLLFEPGTVWAYSDGGINWLADVLTVANGMDLNALMFSRVFTPLGITPADLSWRQNAYRTTTINGIERREMGSGISINVDAMARIGYLYLHQGRWDTVQIIPSDFVASVGTSHGEVSTLDVANDKDNKFRNASSHYGLMWWTNSDGAMAAVPRDAFWAWGLGDNVILVIPSLDIVVSRAGPEFPVSHSPSYYSALEPFFEPIALAD